MTIDQKRERITELSRLIGGLRRQLRHAIYARAVLKRSIARTGQTHSEATKAKMKAAAKARPPISEETRRKLSESARRRAHSVEGRMLIANMVRARVQAKKGVHAQDRVEAKIFGARA